MAATLQTAVLPSQDARKQPAVAALAALGVVYGDIGTSTLYGLKQAVAGGRNADARHRDGHRVADPLVAHPDRRAQIRHSDHARRQSRRGRHRGAARAARRKARAARKLARLPAHRRSDRGRAALWRRRDHAGDLGAQRRRRSQDRRASARADGRSHHHRDPGRSVPGPAQGNGFHRQHLRAGDAGVVRRHRPARPPRHRADTGHPGRDQPPQCRCLPGSCRTRPSASPCSAPPSSPSPAPRRCMPTWAISAGCRSSSDGSPSCCPRSMLNYFGQGGLLLADPDAIENPFYLLAPRWAHYPHGGVRDRGHRHRLAGHHLRRVLAHPAGDPARLPAAHARAAHGQPREGADLHAGRELAAGHRHARQPSSCSARPMRSAAHTASPSRC